MRRFRSSPPTRRVFPPLAILLLALVSACSGGDDQKPGSAAAADGETITVFPGQSIHSAPLWMALEQGYYEDAGLNIEMKAFASGTTALESFRTGQGDIVLSGELPAILHWANVEGDFRVMTPLQRDTEGYVIMARSDIQSPEDLRGKTIATRVGSTGSWFISEYLQRNGIPEEEVEVINLDTNAMPIALDNGDIAAFFIWEPFGIQSEQLSGDAVHRLDDATGYVQGYSVIGARPDWLQNNSAAAVKFVKATERGAEFVRKNPAVVQEYLMAEFGQDKAFVERQLEFSDFVLAFDEEFYNDFSSAAEWASKEGQMNQPLDWNKFLWTEGLEAVDPSRVSNP